MAEVHISCSYTANIPNGGAVEEITNNRHGSEPQAVMTMMSNGQALTGTSNAYRITIGAADGTTEKSIGATNQDAQTIINAQRVADNVAHTWPSVLATTSDYCNWDSWIDDDITPKYGTNQDWTTAPLDNNVYDMLHTHFGGIDCEYVVTSFASNATSGGTVDVNGLTGNPDFGIVFASDRQFTGSVGQDMTISVGAIGRNEDNSLDQWCAVHGENDANTTSDPAFFANPIGAASGARCGGTFTWAGSVGSKGSSIEATGLTGSGFEFTTREAGVAKRWALLMGRCKTSKMQVKVLEKDSPTIVTTDSVTGVGFKPKAIFAVGTLTTGSAIVQNANATGLCWGWADETEEHSICGVIRDAQATSDTKSVTRASLQALFRTTGSEAVTYSTDNWNDDGFDRVFSAVLANAKRSYYLIIGDVDKTNSTLFGCNF